MSEAISTIEYREIKGFRGYRVGSDGSVWSCHRHNAYHYDLSAPWKRLKATADARGGYLRVKLCTGRTGRYTRRNIHQLVLEAFVGPCPEGLIACHANDDPLDNRLENLRWDTYSANTADAIRNGRYDEHRGARHYRAKLTEADVRAIRASHAAGETCRDLGKRFGVSNVLVSLIVRRKSWRWLP